MIIRAHVLFLALLLAISAAPEATADHAADLAKCNAITDAIKRSACLTLIARPGEDPQANTAVAASADSPAPAAVPQGRDACVFNGDFASFQACLDKADAAAAAAPTPTEPEETAIYFAAIARCGEIKTNPTLRSQCLHSVGQPKPGVEIPDSTYDEGYQAAISLCVANRYTIDAEACELDALMQAMQRQRSRGAGSGEAPALPTGQKAKPAAPKRATPGDVVAMLAKLGKGPGRWVIRHERSQITDTENIFLSVASKEIIPRDYSSGGPAYLTLRCLDNETDVLITMAGNWFYDDHPVTSRIDKRPAISREWSQSSDNEAAFHPEPIAFIKQLSGASQLIIQTAPINSPLYLATFDLSGIGDVVKPLRASCGW